MISEILNPVWNGNMDMKYEYTLWNLFLWVHSVLPIFSMYKISNVVDNPIFGPSMGPNLAAEIWM